MDAPNENPLTAEQTEPETVYDAMQRAGLLGCLTGPPDLCMNPAHMEGFGKDGDMQIGEKERIIHFAAQKSTSAQPERFLKDAGEH